MRFDTDRPSEQTVAFDLAGNGEIVESLVWAADGSEIVVSVATMPRREATPERLEVWSLQGPWRMLRTTGGFVLVRRRDRSAGP